MNGNRSSAYQQVSVTDSETAVAPTERALILRCEKLEPENAQDEASVEDRQRRVPKFSQEALSGLTVLLVGAGALGGEIAEGLVRKGVGTLKILDFDTVGLSDLNRQFFFSRDKHKPKAWALARNLYPHGAMGTTIIAWNLAFENAQEMGIDLSCDVIVSAVDDAETRIAISRFSLDHKVPALFGGASITADFANLFIQAVNGPCFACAFPGETSGERTPCPGSPAIKDLFKQLGGLALYAIDSLVMERPRNWNLFNICPADASFSPGGMVGRRDECPICGGLP